MSVPWFVTVVKVNLPGEIRRCVCVFFFCTVMLCVSSHYHKFPSSFVVVVVSCTISTGLVDKVTLCHRTVSRTPPKRTEVILTISFVPFSLCSSRTYVSTRYRQHASSVQHDPVRVSIKPYSKVTTYRLRRSV